MNFKINNFSILRNQEYQIYFLILFFFLVVFGLFIYCFYIYQPVIKEQNYQYLENKRQETLKKLTAPVQSSYPEPPKEVLNNLTAPQQSPQVVPQDVLDRLTAPKK